ncbi:MAG TPA: type IV pilus secretin PilQ [Vicinamibacterales bacterium]|nr:type IV pilus secretin PilQ [Vicinamibacterales bacterium]
MTVTRGLALLLTVATAGALVNASSAPDGASTTVRLKAISARVHAKGASLVIEASEPVAYTASRPDALTVLLDFRNVGASNVANSVAADVKSPIAHVSVEVVQSLGAPASRVRIALSQPVAHHVRSERNTVIVDFDKPSAKAAPFVLPPSSRQSSVVSQQSSNTPDAMLALQGAPTGDPIAALGLDPVPGGPSASSTSVVTMAVPSARPPVVVQSPDKVAALLAAVQAPAPPQMPAPQPITPDQTGSNARGRTFTGHPISLDFQGADLRAVLRTFAEISGLNMVIDPKVTGTVDVALRDVPWDQALDIILRANKLGYSVDGTIVRIAPNAVLKAEEDERKALLDSQNDASQLGTMQRQLSYAKGEEVATLLKSANVLSKRGQANVDPRTNTLIVRDVPSQFPEITTLIDGIDRAQPQVEIEARIVQTNKTYARALGVQWGFGGRVDPTLGNTTNLAFPNNGSLTGRVGGTQGPASGATTNQPTAVNLGVAGPNSAVGLALGSVNGAFNLDVALSALESTGNGRLLSTPRVTTQNNIPAEMTQGVQIPIQTVANNTVTVSFKDAALTLKVTPQITAANTVIMSISVENASPDFSRAVNNIPPINTQRANTQVLVSDGQTTVIGGIYVSNEQVQTDRTPGLGQIPLLKWLFKRDTVNDSNTELLIFITPRIIKS